ncbi:MAG: phytoene synthase [Rhodobacteraceae bacterium]|nr:phytoene synthase [Paracoccaceae bacterium]
MVGGLSQDIALCAETVRMSDPDRFLSAMTANVAERDGLMVLYAFNVEVSRSPWVTAEPIVAEMRLQWWFDAIEEIFDGGAVRRHQVVTPLAELVRARGLRRDWLDGMIRARRWDIYKEAHVDQRALDAYLAQTGGGLMGLAVAASGGDGNSGYDYGTGCTVARLLEAAPKLEELGRYHLVDRTEVGVKLFAEAGLAKAEAARQLLRKTPRSAQAALRAEWLAKVILRQAKATPALVGKGGLGVSEAHKKLRLMWLTAVKKF